MTSRERVRIALDHGEPDRIPIDFGGLLASINVYTYDALLKEVGLPAGGDEVVSREWSNVPKPSEELLRRWHVDFRRVWLGGPEKFIPIVDAAEGTLKDEWGLTWKRFGRYNELVNPPLVGAGIPELMRYAFPDPADPGRYRGVREWAERLFRETDHAVIAGHSMFGVFELGCWLCGFDDFMTRLVLDTRFVRVFFDRVLEIQKEIVGRYLDLVGPYIQIVETADDLGQENGPMISPETYRQLIKPYHKAYLRFIRDKVPHARIFMHSCGSVYDLVPDLIDNGVDILNPVRAGCQKYGAVEVEAGLRRPIVLPRGHRRCQSAAEAPAFRGPGARP